MPHFNNSPHLPMDNKVGWPRKLTTRSHQPLGKHIHRRIAPGDAPAGLSKRPWYQRDIKRSQKKYASLSISPIIAKGPPRDLDFTFTSFYHQDNVFPCPTTCCILHTATRLTRLSKPRLADEGMDLENTVASSNIRCTSIRDIARKKKFPQVVNFINDAHDGESWSADRLNGLVLKLPNKIPVKT